MDAKSRFKNRWIRVSLICGFSALPLAVSSPAQATDLKISIPKRSAYTPVQRLNRDGVEAIRKHNYAKAEKLFYKAYLYDPDDPFTLNNLGYIAELQGQLDRAERFYTLAAAQPSDAVIARASSRRVEGQTLQTAVLGGGDQSIQVNHANVEAVRLLSQGRAQEADSLLETACKTDPHNAFTLLNLGVAKEMQGEDQLALRYYEQAASANTNASAVVTPNQAWRGRAVREIAEESLKALRARLANVNTAAEQVAELNLRGVSAVNRNDLREAETDFRKAYALDPNNAFTLNNIAYVAELHGDRETAEFFYQRAKNAYGANAIVAVATRHSEEGKPLVAVASTSDRTVDAKLTQEHETVRRQNEPVVLWRRDDTVVNEDAPPAVPSDQNPPPQ